MIKNEDVASLRDAAIEDLERSGLDYRDFQKLQLEILTPSQTEDFVGEARASYRIQYFDMDRRPIKYSRVRFIQNKKKRFSKTEGTHRYSQPANSAPHVYLPPYFSWRKVANDPSIPIVITEGEKKAASACKAGIVCLALGGVWSFLSKKRDWQMLPELQALNWKGRDIEVCYDNDVMQKAEVRVALSALATELSQNHAPNSISFVYLDSDSNDDANGKLGLDDFLVQHGVDAFLGLERHPFRSAAKIQELNTKVCYVQKQERFFSIVSGKYFKNFQHVREAYMHAGEELVDGKNKDLVINQWAKNAGRRTVEDIVYSPGVSELTENNELNLWKAPNLQPKKKTPKKWLELVHYVFRKPEYSEWFLRWLAYPVQNPGEKLLSAVFVYGKKQGVGKTFVVDPVMEFIYGKDNFHRLDNDSLKRDYNSYVAKRQFIVADEVYLADFKDRKGAMGKLKNMITRETAQINEKFQPEFTHPDYCNYYMSSNHKDALMLEKEDRRCFVIEAPDKKLPQAFYDELDIYIREGDGSNAILHYLANLDLGDFNPKAAALDTVWKSEVADLSVDEITEFAERLIEDPAPLFMMDGHLPELQLFRAEDLMKVFEHAYGGRKFYLTVKKMANTIIDRRLENRKVRTSADGDQFSLYAIFDRDRWATKKNREWAEHYTATSRLYGGKSRH